MRRGTSRRTLIGALSAAAGGFIQTLHGYASGGRAPAGSAGALAANPALTIALLDEHWDRIQETVESYAQGLEIKIEAKPLSYDELYGQLSLALTQQAPAFDIVSLVDPWIPQFASFLNPLDAPADLLEAFVPVTATLGSYPAGAGVCALPWIGDAQFFAARPEWLAREGHSAPDTWDDTVETASALTATMEPDSGLFSFAISTRTGSDLVDSFLPILRGYGKAIIDAETSVPQLDTPEALGAMATFQALAELSPIESGATGEPSNAEKFETGQVTMMADFWSTDLLSARLAEDTVSNGPISIGFQPAQDGMSRESMTGVWLLGIPVGSIMAGEAWRFLQWLTDRPFQESLPAAGLPPAREDVYKDASIVAASPDLPVLLQMLESATPRPRSPFYPQLEQLLANELKNVLAGDKTGAVALKDANVAIREFLVREGVLTV